MELLQIKPRLYQELISAQCTKANTLVVLPTGLGKTMISVLLAIHTLQQQPTKKVLILAPTRPLVQQHYETFCESVDFDQDKMTVFTGNVSPEKRKALFDDCQIIFSTPQGLENDVLASRIKLDQVALLVFDEAHKAVGDYSYVWLAKQYMSQCHIPLILGLTASPGTSKESIDEVMQNLAIEQLEYREKTAADVAPYVKKTKTRFLEVDLPPDYKVILDLLHKAEKSRISNLKSMGYFRAKPRILKTELLQFTGSIQKEIAMGKQSPEAFIALSVAAQIIKVQHAVELAETQGIPSLHAYLKGIYDQADAKKSKAVISLSKDPYLRLAYTRACEFFEQGITHPKISLILESLHATIKKNPRAKVIIFSQYRDTLQTIVNKINEFDSVHAEMFVGQAKKKGTGLSQKKQIEMIERFRDGQYNVLCMSSVGEEGLDIPSVDRVIFYEPIPSAIRSIQRRGRTGRQDLGHVDVLCARDTRDMAFRWIAHRKEKAMYKVLEDYKKPEPKIQRTLQETIQKDITIYADSREKQSGVLRLLHDKVNIDSKQLSVGDFVLSKDVVVEFKRVSDFVDSLIDGRLLSQLKELKATYLKPLVVVEGEESIFAARNIHPNAVYGMLSTIAVSYHIPVLFTKNEQDTANLFYLIAKREQQGSQNTFTPHASNKPTSKKEQLEYVISAIPGVGMQTAKKLLAYFGTPKALFSASVEEMCNVEGVGEKTAQSIADFFTLQYD